MIYPASTGVTTTRCHFNSRRFRLPGYLLTLALGLSIARAEETEMAPNTPPATTTPATMPATAKPGTPVAVAPLPHLAKPTEKEMIPLYTDRAPGALGETDADIPAMEVHWAAPPATDVKPTKSVFLVLPGGGYAGLVGHEWNPPADWLTKNGITVFVVRYRVGPKYHHPVELTDAQRAIRYVRAHAQVWGLDPKHIGILGFSAGGHLASTTATHFDAGNPQATDPVARVSSRPDVQVLVYPVITMKEGGHSFSKEMLLGPKPDPKVMEFLSSDKQVTKNTPPAFLAHSTKDSVVPVSNSDNYAAALKKQGIPYQYVRGEYGDHGFIVPGDPGLALKEFWTKPCMEWLHKQGF